MTQLTVLALSGSLRAKSYNTALLHEARRLAPVGMTVDIASIREIPLYDADLEARGFPQAVTALSARVKSADALLIATPWDSPRRTISRAAKAAANGITSDPAITVVSPIQFNSTPATADSKADEPTSIAR